MSVRVFGHWLAVVECHDSGQKNDIRSLLMHFLMDISTGGAILGALSERVQRSVRRFFVLFCFLIRMKWRHSASTCMLDYSCDVLTPIWPRDLTCLWHVACTPPPFFPGLYICVTSVFFMACPPVTDELLEKEEDFVHHSWCLSYDLKN